jgi:ElaB/YqjD/DUF883 family membrane-anchored ribosome-binding protein
MPNDSFNALDDGDLTAAQDQAANGRQAFSDALVTAERTLKQATKSAERLLTEGAEVLRAQTKIYAKSAGEQFDEAQKQTLDGIKSRPLTSTLAGLAVGFLFGVVLSGRGK